MVNTKPRLVQKLEIIIKKRAKRGNYRIVVTGIQIDVFPYVFPPNFTKSSYVLYSCLNNLEGQRVLDIGTGTGIQAIQAVKAGAIEFDAVDINEDAVECARHNMRLNGLDDRIKEWQSDLFSNVPIKEYDLIIANLPIVDVEEEDVRFHSLYDPGFNYHKRLFKEALGYLSHNGRLFIPHANLQEEGFRRIEELAENHGFSYQIVQSVNYLGYEWRNYELWQGVKKKWKYYCF